MRVRTYEVLRMAVGEGINSGIHRAFKHSEENPLDEDQRELLTAALDNAIMEAIDGWFTFDGEDQDL